VCGQLVVLVGAGRADVDVLEEVGERPAVGAADRIGRHARSLERLRILEEVVPGLGRLDACVLEDRDVVPDGRLVGPLEEEAVELAVNRPELDGRRGVVRRDRVLGEVDRLDLAALGVLLDRPGLGDRRQVGRIAALHGRREDGDDVVAGGVVLDVDVGALLLEAVENGLDRFLLGRHPDAHERDGSRAALGSSCRARPPSLSTSLFAPTARRGHEEEHCEQPE
jgi:hypothetical protein